MKVIKLLSIIIVSIILVAIGLQIIPGSHVEATAKNQKDTDTARLTSDLLRLQAFSRELEEMAVEMDVLMKTFGLKERGHYISTEHDKVENLLFRYLACRDSLWDIINFYRSYMEHFKGSEEQTKGFIIGFNAALHLAHYSSLLVSTFAEEPQVINKLNEAYYRSGVPRGTYDKLFESVTSVDNIETLKTAWQLLSDELTDQSSILFKISKSDPVYGNLVNQINDYYDKSILQMQYILEENSLLLPNVANRLRQTAIIIKAKAAKDKFGDNLYAARGILFLNVSRIKSALASNIDFTSDQLQKIKSMLQPVDIILTFSDGYMSNVFLPGKFKHGITYVGSPEQRATVGLSPEKLCNVPDCKIEKLSNDLKCTMLSSGHDADLLEAVAEGVIFNSLEQITDEHLSRMLVLRPRLKTDEKIKYLTTAFLLLGNGYDFKFDFDNASYQCCTEVIYRALNGVGPVRLSLTRRMGTETLSADDIIHYYLTSGKDAFNFVLLAEEKANTNDNRAVILTGKKGKKRLICLMKEE